MACASRETVDSRASGGGGTTCEPNEAIARVVALLMEPGLDRIGPAGSARDAPTLVGNLELTGRPRRK